MTTERRSRFEDFARIAFPQCHVAQYHEFPDHYRTVILAIMHFALAARRALTGISMHCRSRMHVAIEDGIRFRQPRRSPLAMPLARCLFYQRHSCTATRSPLVLRLQFTACPFAWIAAVYWPLRPPPDHLRVEASASVYCHCQDCGCALQPAHNPSPNARKS